MCVGNIIAALSSTMLMDGYDMCLHVYVDDGRSIVVDYEL